MHYPPGKVYTNKIPSVKYSVAKHSKLKIIIDGTDLSLKTITGLEF